MDAPIAMTGLDYKPDAARACERMAAWWEGAILDRPTLQVSAPKPNPKPRPQKQHASPRERWMDVAYVVRCAEARIANTYWGGELLPSFHPNLGPDFLAAALGAELSFDERTSWSAPLLKDWAQIPKLALRPDNIYVRAMLELTERALEVGRGKFLVGLTDLHPGGDLAAALRGSQQLCVDLALEPERVRELMQQLAPTFFEFYELQHALLRKHGQTLTSSWLPLYAEGRYYIPSNDFSCMVSPEMFREFFLEEILAEIEWLDRSIYHLDGPQALRHLDTLLEIEKLDAVQWVWGAGNGPAAKWMNVLRRIQEAGKNLHLSAGPSEINALMEGLRPEGVMIRTSAGSVEEAEALIAKVAKWPGKL